LFPDECRICNRPLTKITRIPVCADCLSSPKPLLAAYFCRSCHTPFSNAFPLDQNGLCTLCAGGMRGFDRAYSFGFYEGPLRKLIHLFKYSGIKPLAKRLAGLLLNALPEDDAEQFDVVVPMPLHWRRRWQRGFNQSELLARLVAAGRGLPMLNAVKRIRATAMQAGLTNSNRRKNVAGAFRVASKRQIAGKRILLIDDVMTTGATASVCASVLKRAGARSVTLLTLARVDRRFTQFQSTARKRPAFEEIQR
jgi:ComF family protein